ncbi:SusC/RagA family TonB-linked outer membrane protein [Pinibacter soli]|uniref:TonB-dependent receptor n=1 Tax=Pinibacter soli TaxID=3044211 RepID=A0ABT6RFD9_9BACT|nr:TonB-dependent receptor [Pinibacter soli]MDI3321120.1 TonB-dependent receptor [Pinibacter soli]
MKRLLFSLLLLLSITAVAVGQSTQLKGRIVDVDGKPVQGASIFIDKTQTGVSSGEDGTFVIPVKDASKTYSINVSSKGFKSATNSVKVGVPANVVLEKEVSNMDEVVVIGYGTAKKKDLTGSVSAITGKELLKAPVTNIAEAMTGKMAGVQVTTTEGSPDADIKIRVRGGGSVSQDNSPLYVVDGFPVNSINNISPSDIQSMTILKDAASTAIYGARGANGVVLITTKDAKAGKTTVSANAYWGVKKLTKELNVLSPYEYVRYQYELDPTYSTTTTPTTFTNNYGAFSDLDIYKSQSGTDFQKEVFGRTGFQQYYNVGVTGGTKSTKYNVGLTRNDEKSIMIGSGYERNNLSFKLQSDISDKLTFDFINRTNYTVITGAGVNTGSGANTRLRNSVKYAPTKGLKGFAGVSDDDDMNSPESLSLLYNPVESANDEYKKQYQFASNFNSSLSWKIIKGLTFKTLLGYEFQNQKVNNVWGPATPDAKTLGGQPIGRIANSSGYTWINSNTLTIDPKLKSGHTLNVVLGQEITTLSATRSVTNESRFFPKDWSADMVLANMQFGTAIPTKTYDDIPNRMSSFFGRANYSYLGRYLATVTFREDGSSKFAGGNRWGFFPSLALAWRVSDEKFMEPESKWLNSLKVRASVGTAGNNRIPDNLYKQTLIAEGGDKYYMPNETPGTGVIPSTILYNPDLKWETTLTRNVGLDFGVLNNKLSGTLDFYWNTTHDLLVQSPIAENSGYLYQIKNVGQTSNRGIELTLNGQIVSTKDFSLNAGFNISFNKNKVDRFPNGNVNFKTYNSGWNGTASPLEDYIVKEGQPIGEMYGYITEGMYTFDDFTFDGSKKNWVINKGVASDNSLITTSNGYFGPGTLKLRDLNDDGVIDEKDKTVIGHALPTHTGGFNLTGQYKNFDFSAFFNWSYGNDIYNANKIDFTSYLLTRKYQNLTTDMDLAHRFTTIDPETGYNVYSGKDADPARLQEINKNATIWHPMMTSGVFHSWAVEDGSFLRLNTATIGYSLPKAALRRAKFQSIRVYVTGYNLYNFTKYSGFDPEVDTRRSTPLTPGVDYSAYPKSRSFVGGLNITF